MKNRIWSLLLLLAMTFSIIVACAPTSSPQTAGLFIVVGNSAASFAGNGSGDGLLLDKFSKESGIKLYVKIANDREIREYRDLMLTGREGAPDVLIVDDSLDADGLQKAKLIASHKVGAAIRSDIADSLGLQGNTISYTDFVPMLKSGSISVVASNALAGSASREFFFSTMAWCAEMDASNLTADIVKLDYVKTCGKDVYDFIKSTNGSNEALNTVYKAAVSDSAGDNAIITFDSDLMGENGLNAKLASQRKPIFKFYYFREATAQASVAIGTRDLSKEMTKSNAADSLISYLIDEKSPEGKSQAAINLAGFTEGSAALVHHIDTAFKPEWGVASNPVGVQVVNAPISAVSDKAMIIYRDLYKRTKVTKACIDSSPSMTQTPKMKIFINGQSVSVFKIQALNRAILKITDPEWLNKNQIVPGPNDVFEYYLFSTMTSKMVVSSIGPDTKQAGLHIDSLIGPWNENDPQNWSKQAVESRLKSELDGFVSSGTEMFDCANLMLDQIEGSYNPNVDYIIVILTDGENNDYSITAKTFYDKWKATNHSNITVIGIAFGTDGKSLKEKFGDTTFNGADDQGLIDAFKVILGN